MAFRLALLLLLGASVRPGCKPEERIWVEQVFSGGQQCVDDDAPPAPNSREVLGEAGIAVFAYEVEDLAVCEACTICPDYSELHKLQIGRSDLGKAEALGYRPGT